MFAIYITLTKGQTSSFKQFIRPSLVQRLIGYLTGAQVANKCLDDQVKCFRLFKYFFEADDKDACRSIENAKIFNSKVIIINEIVIRRGLIGPFSYSSIQFEDNTLSLTDVVCLTVFLTCSSHKEWHKLNLHYCYIQDHGVKILHCELTRCNLTITELILSHNSLTESCFPAITDIIISCRVKGLWIDGYLCESEKLNLIISNPSSTLEILNIACNNLSSVGAIKLFTVLGEATCKFKQLNVRGCHLSVTDEVCDAIIMAMMKNTSLTELDMYGNQISKEHMELTYY